MRAIDARKVHFIKLGEGGEWEQDCLRDGTLRFGYHETPHELCLAGEWDRVRAIWLDLRGHPGTATNDARQIRAFYETGPDSVFITFHGGCMFWCRPTGIPRLCADRTKLRSTMAGWSNESDGGARLTTDRLSGHLLKVQGFRGTICDVSDRDYVLRRLNDEVSPEVASAEMAEQALRGAVVGLLRLLTWQDFELLVDLIFSTSGWRRVGIVGRAQKTVDLELVLPTTGERAFVQVKAQANSASLQDYVERFVTGAYDRMFFVWHSGNVSATALPPGVSCIGPGQLARMVVDAGLSTWLREKVA